MTSRLLVIAIAFALAVPHASAGPDAPTGSELYQQAVAAFTAGDNAAAQSLAMKSAMLPGSHKLAAKFLYGDALFRAGEHLRARAVYVALRDMTSGDQRATATKKISAVNRKLGLPEDTTGAPVRPAAVQVTPVKPSIGDELYARAIAAVRRDDLDGARELAIKAAIEDGTHRIDAKVLYGDLLARRGEHARAKDVFLTLRRMTTGDVRAIVTAKVVAENRALQLPDTDGITD
jgi:TolA-binding protein